MRKIKKSQIRKVLKKVDKKTLNKRTLVKNEEVLNEVKPEKKVTIYNHEKNGLAKFARDYYVNRLGLEIEKGTIALVIGDSYMGENASENCFYVLAKGTVVQIFGSYIRMIT
jgi:hypothetical protein